MLIFVIFVANPGVTKFYTHEIFTRTLVQVCEHQQSSCFVDVVASHARLNTEVLHLSSSLVYPDAYRRECGYVFLVETKTRIACTEIKVRITLLHMCATKFNSEGLFQIFMKISTHENNPLYGILNIE